MISRWVQSPRWYWLLGIMLGTTVFLAMVIFGEEAGVLPAGTVVKMILGNLALSTDQLLGFFTFPFFHAFQFSRDLIHFVATMLAFILVSPELERRLGGRGYCALFFVSAIGAGLAHLVFSVTILDAERTHHALGASGGVYGLLFAYWRLFPQARPLRLLRGRYLAPILCVILFFSGFASAWDAPESGLIVEHRTQAAGIVFGWGFLLLVPRLGQLRARREKARQIRGILRDTDLMARVDDLLDKIAQEGMDSLSRAEKRYLERASLRYRGLLRGGEKPAPGGEDR